MPRVRQELENTVTRLSTSSCDHITRVFFRYIMTGLKIVYVGIYKVVVQIAERMNVRSVQITKFFHNRDNKERRINHLSRECILSRLCERCNILYDRKCCDEFLERERDIYISSLKIKFMAFFYFLF